MKNILFCFVITFLFCAFFFNAKTSAQVSGISFQLISEEDLKPIVGRTVYVFNGDHEFKAGPGFNPYPYDNTAKKKEWYLGAIKTDAEGKFVLNIKAIKTGHICFQAGSPYRLMDIEKSSDISHSPSDSHIRIVRFEKGLTKVKRNDIYDLNKGVIKKIWLDGKIEEVPFKDVALIAQNDAVNHYFR